MPSVVIVNYGVGNLTSVSNALKRLSVDTVISDDPQEIASATHLIFPGVGSFQEGMKGIADRGLVPILREEVMKKKKPILGICLGMQLLASRGMEHGEFEGLGCIPGVVRKIETTLRLPHIGWNDVVVTGKHAIAANFSAPPVFYFVHSYQFIPEDRSVIAGTCEYGETVTALIQSGNICGAQFHPEKSNDDGLQIFRNFLAV